VNTCPAALERDPAERPAAPGNIAEPPRHEGMSLRFRLNLMIAASVLLILGVGFLFGVHAARRSVEDEIRSTVYLAGQLIEAGAPSPGGEGRPLADWPRQLASLDRTRHLRIRIADRAEPLPAEPAAAQPGPRVPDWFRWLVAPPTIVETRTLADGAGGALTLRIEADAGDEIAEAWQETRGFLLLLLALSGAVYLLVHFTVGRAFRSVGTILEGLEGIEKGEYGQRLPPFRLREFDRISGAFNHMAAALEKARDENRALVRQSLSVQEEERRFLARELHDELGQSVTAIKIMAAALRNNGEGRREAAEQILGLCDRLFGVVRAMMRRLRPSTLDELGLAASLEDLVEDWRGRHPGIDVDFRCEPDVDASDETAHIHLFRIVQECLTNVSRHAGARRVDIRLHLSAAAEEEWIVLRVEDDGAGFELRERQRGFGLLGMRERVAGLGGRLDIVSAPGRGTAVEVRLPASEANP
jgi:two-component system sensor histidine kinase UhpB